MAEDRIDPVYKYIDSKVHSLNTRLGKLTKRVESLELLDFQSQLDRLNEHLTKLSNEFSTATKQHNDDLLGNARLIAKLNVNLSLLWAAFQLRVKVDQASSFQSKAESCYDFIKDHAIEVLTEINHSQNPMSEYYKWCDTCQKHLGEQGVNISF